VEALWEDHAIQKAWKACKNYQIQVSQLDYMMENLDRIREPNFVPNNEDIVRGRQRTAGAYSTKFVAFKVNWEIIDVGGQSPERKKWTTIVREGFTSIIYFAALDEYNMESNEDKGKTKMDVSMNVFDQVINDEENFDCCNILFLNKIDLFKEKILTQKGSEEFEEKFPDFKEYMKSGKYKEDMNKNKDFVPDIGNSDEKVFWGSVNFIKRKFTSLVKNEEKQLAIYPTCAIETEHMNLVFENLKELIFVKRLEESKLEF